MQLTQCTRDRTEQVEKQIHMYLVIFGSKKYTVGKRSKQLILHGYKKYILDSRNDDHVEYTEKSLKTRSLK